MKHLLYSLALLLMLTGCQSNHASQSGYVAQPEDNASSEVKLTLKALENGGVWRVLLDATEGDDIYQIAGAISYPNGQYEILAIEAGGGLGGPAECFFTGRETQPGRIDYAYTKRYHGSGVSGPATLVSVVIQPLGSFSLEDFRIEQDLVPCVVRNSDKQTLDVVIEGVQQ